MPISASALRPQMSLAPCRIMCGVVAAFCLSSTIALAQTGTRDTAVPTPLSPQQVQEKLQLLSAALTAAQERLQQSQADIQKLQQDLAALQSQAYGPSQASQSSPASATVASSRPETAAVTDIAEKVDILQAEIKQHEQTKVESLSKYPVRFTGLVLFNSFVDKGTVDNLDLASAALPSAAGVSDLATAASVRQTILGVQANGPRIFGARSYAEVDLDFDGGLLNSTYGAQAGIVRMRSAALRLLWEDDTVEGGLVQPLISPLSPTSYAAVAEPALAWAGNLWTWAPQLSFEHRFPVSGGGRVGLQIGLWDPPSATTYTIGAARPSSFGERSGQPAYESRLSYARHDPVDGLQLGLGGYYSRQNYGGRNGDSWVTTGDWRVPIGSVFEFSGEAYRGRAIGGLGGGAYKDVVYGIDPKAGYFASFRLLNAAGGWAQAKFHLTRTLETNATFGMDDGFARDFHSILLPSNATSLQLRARNQMATFNLIFAPKTYLVLSPEFRRIHTWPISDASATADIFTMTFGLRF